MCLIFIIVYRTGYVACAFFSNQKASVPNGNPFYAFCRITTIPRHSVNDRTSDEYSLLGPQAFLGEELEREGSAREPLGKDVL